MTATNQLGIDGFTPYYDVELKHARHRRLTRHAGFTAHRVMLEDQGGLAKAFEAGPIDAVIHLAAQAGVR